MHKVLLCLSLVSLSFHPGSTPRHIPLSRNGGKLVANATKKPNFGCSVLRPRFVHRCVSCNTPRRWVFQTKKASPSFHLHQENFPGCFPARLQHICHCCCLSSVTLVLFTSEKSGNTEAQTNMRGHQKLLFSFQDNLNHFLRGIFSWA